MRVSPPIVIAPGLCRQIERSRAGPTPATGRPPTGSSARRFSRDQALTRDEGKACVVGRVESQLLPLIVSINLSCSTSTNPPSQDSAGPAVTPARSSLALS